MVQGEAWAEAFVLDPGRGLGEALLALFRVQGDAWPEPFVLGSGRGPSA